MLSVCFDIQRQIAPGSQSTYFNTCISNWSLLRLKLHGVDYYSVTSYYRHLILSLSQAVGIL